jgi:hypothetical protein
LKHKGVEYTVERTTTPAVWKWKFRIGDKVVTGKTETAINFLAIRRVQQRIDREQKKLHVTNNCTRKSMPAFSLSTIRKSRLHHAVSGVRPPLRTSGTEPAFAHCDWIIPA